MQHPPNTFCFAELHTPNVDTAIRFYDGLFGWKAVAVPGTSGYLLCQRDGQTVVALRRAAEDPRWIPHVRVESVDEALVRARSLRATVVVSPFDTIGVARTCVLEDRDGASFGLWESRGRDGADLQDAPGSMWWVELLARDVVASREFYTSLFGWRFDTTDKYGPFTKSYHVFRSGDTAAAGAVQYERDWGVKQRWQVLFAIDDWDAVTNHAASLGGTLGFWRDVPETGRLGLITDPTGAVFCVMKPSRP